VVNSKPDERVITRLHICVQCASMFAFQEDLREHQKATGHVGMSDCPFS
jgi:hypothetical protein